MRSTLIALTSLIALAFWYTYPGSQALVEGRTDSFMSDGTDETPVVYSYDLVRQVWEKHPSYLFYGSILFENVDPMRGAGLWAPWSERWLVLIGSYFLPMEQLSTGFIFALFVMTGMSMFFLTRYLGWNFMVSLGLSIAWAFNCYTRARAKVHGAMVGIYHLPLIFLGLFLVARGKSWRSLAAAALAFLVAGTTAHYYLVTCIFLSPFFLLFLAMQPEFLGDWKRISGRMGIAVAPLVAFLGLNFVYTVPPGANLTAAESMNIPVAKPNEPHPFSGFLNTFYAHPIDYLAGDISLHDSPSDINPLRALVNEEVLHNIGYSNSHERTNGVRWSILILSLFALFALARGRFRKTPDVQRNMMFFAIFAFFTFWLSLSPNIPFENWGASYFLFWLMPKIRVASRSGINVHFALLMITGLYMSTQFKWREYLLLPGVFALLMIVDYFPYQDMPMAPMRPAYTLLQRDKGPCGPGMAFPFTSGLLGTSIDYANSQRLRGSDCPWLNRMGDSERIRWLTMQFPPAQEFMDQLTKSSQTGDKLVALAKCVPLNWIIFHEATPRTWAAGVCGQLGWMFNEDMSCIAPDKSRPLKTPPERCL